MGIRDYLSGIGDKFRSYFSKGSADPTGPEDERGRNAQVGYKERENWFDKFLSYSGAVLKYMGLTTVALTGVGAIALGVQYLRGSFPYKDVRENAFAITQNRLNEKPAKPLKQGVNFFFSPFV